MKAPTATMANDGGEDLLTPRRAAQFARELYRLRGELADLQKQEKVVAGVLREYLRQTGEPIDQEGLPALRLRELAGPRSWDVLSMPADMVRFLQERGALTCNGKVVDGLAQQSLLPVGFKSYEMTGVVERLEFDRPGRMKE